MGRALALVIVIVAVLVALRLSARGDGEFDTAAGGPSAKEGSGFVSSPDAVRAFDRSGEHVSEAPGAEPMAVAPAFEKSAPSDEPDSAPPAIAEPETQSHEQIVENVLNAIDTFFAAGFDGDVEAAAAVSKPGSSVAEQAEDVTGLTSDFPDLPMDVYGGWKHALAVSWLAEAQQPNGPQKGYLVFSLEQNESGAWLIEDIDFENEEGATLEIDRFIETYEAELLTPSSVGQVN